MKEKKLRILLGLSIVLLLASAGLKWWLEHMFISPDFDQEKFALWSDVCFGLTVVFLIVSVAGICQYKRTKNPKGWKVFGLMLLCGFMTWSGILQGSSIANPVFDAEFTKADGDVFLVTVDGGESQDESYLAVNLNEHRPMLNVKYSMVSLEHHTNRYGEMDYITSWEVPAYAEDVPEKEIINRCKKYVDKSNFLQKDKIDYSIYTMDRVSLEGFKSLNFLTKDKVNGENVSDYIVVIVGDTQVDGRTGGHNYAVLLFSLRENQIKGYAPVK